MWRVALRTVVARRRRLLATASAVLLGVAFLTGTLVLADTVAGSVAQLAATATDGTDVLVRSSAETGVEDVRERGLVDGSLAATVAAVDGVDAVAPRIETVGRIVGADGDPVGGDGPTIAGNWVDDARLTPYDLADGRAPRAPGEVVIDRASADEGSLAIGDRTIVRTPEPVEATVVGLARVGAADSLEATTYAAFTTEFAADVLVPDPATVSAIAVAGEPGVGQEELAHRLDAELPDSVETVTGAELAAELRNQIQGEDQEGFQQVLYVFTGIALVVAAFSIHTTFSILVAQRTRDAALLRALGATRRQVLGSVAVEAAGVGVLGSAGGVAAGVVLARLLCALMGTVSLTVPDAPLTLGVATAVTAVAVGLGATLAATLGPAVRASRVAPLAALRDVAVDRSATSRLRAVGGAVVAGGGIAVSVAGATGEDLTLAGLGAVATLVGVVALGPVVARPAVAVLSAPLAARRGPTGLLAGRNAARHPRRTAGTALSLTIGVALVSLFTVIAASLERSIDVGAAQYLASELAVVGEGRGGVSTDLAPALTSLPEIAAASPLGGAPVRIDGRDTLASTVDPATIGSVADLGVEEGSLRELGDDEVAISVAYGREHGLAMGDMVSIDYPDGTTGRASVGAVYAHEHVVATTGIALPRAAFLPHTSRPSDTNILIDVADGVSVADAELAAQRVADRFGAPDVQTNAEVTDAIAREIATLLAVVYVLLAVAVVIAGMGIVNTLSLAVHERTRELGLLRAVGQTRRQARAMVRGEAVVVSLFGTAGGLAVGGFLAWVVVRALAAEGLTSFVLPLGPLAVVLAAGALVGVVAAVHPARVATRADVLAAIGAE
jgi:putative ABC transport system permease protein